MRYNICDMEKPLRKFLLCLHVKNFSAVDAAKENEAGHPARWAPTGVDWNLPAENTLRRQTCRRTHSRVPIRHSLRTGEQLPDGLLGAGRRAGCRLFWNEGSSTRVAE